MDDSPGKRERRTENGKERSKDRRRETDALDIFIDLN